MAGCLQLKTTIITRRMLQPDHAILLVGMVGWCMVVASPSMKKRLCDFKLGKPVHLTINNGIMYVNDAICFDRSASTLSNCSWIALLANNRTSSGVIEKANEDYKVHRFSAYEES